MYSTAPKRTWREVGSKRVCDVSAGETYLSKSPGKVSNLEECKKTCEDASGCQSITYFKSGWCSHFGTACTKTKKNNKAVTALRLSTATSTSKPKVTTGQFGIFGVGTTKGVKFNSSSVYMCTHTCQSDSRLQIIS